MMLRSFPDFNFFGIMQLFGVLVTARLWGVGPSLFATFSGAAIVVLFHKNQLLQGPIGVVADLIGLGIYVIVGCAISSLVSQAIHAQQVANAAQQVAEIARRDAEQLAQSYQREKTRLAAVIEAVPDELSICDIHGKLIQMNQAAREVTNSTARSLPLCQVGDLPLCKVTGCQMRDKKLPFAPPQGERIHGMEYMEYLPSGQQRYLSISMAPIALAAGAVEEVVVIAHDITELKQAQQAEAQRASEFEVLFDALIDAVIVMDSEGRIVRANAAYRQLCADLGVLELPLQERMAYFDIRTDQGEAIPLEALPGARIVRGEVLQGPTAVDLQIYSPTQGIRYHNTNGAPLRNETGEIIGGVMVLRDITERRQWEQQTRNALDELVTIASEVVHIPIKQEDVAENTAQRIAELIGQVLQCRHVAITMVASPNERMSFAAITGVTSDEARRIRAFFEGRDLGEFLSMEYIARLRRGEMFSSAIPPSFALTGVAVLSPRALVAPMLVEDRLIGMISFDFGPDGDTSSPEHMLVAATIPKLSALALERERLLQQQAAAQARILALQQAKEQMDIFLNMASHELRTPLTSVMGYVQLARKRLSRLQETMKESQESRLAPLIELLDDADAQAAYLNRLVGDLLEASRAEGRRLSLQYAVCDITEVIQEAIQGQQVAWPHRRIALRGEDEISLLVRVDRGRILQVVTNYLTNALKYSSPDSPVTVGVRRDREQVRVVVIDHGPGIPDEERERIWERFYRIEGTAPQNGVIPGLGMGLYLSRAIVEQHGGQVGVDSRMGEGSTFWFTLPLYHECGADGQI